MRTTLATFVAVLLSACFSPIPEAESELLPVSKVGGGSTAGGSVIGTGGGSAGGTQSMAGGTAAVGGGSAGGSAQSPVIIPATPETRVVDRLAPNPPAAWVESSETSIDGGCRGDDFLRGVAPVRCNGSTCIVHIGPGRVATVLGEGNAVVATSETLVAWTRSTTNRMMLVIGGLNAAPREFVLASGNNSNRKYAFDGDDLLVLSSANMTNELTRYSATSVTTVGTAPGAASYNELEVDADGRVWFITSQGLYRSRPRGEAGIDVVPTLGLPANLRAVAPVGRGSALVAHGSDVWLTDGAQGLVQLASLPSERFISAIRGWSTGFAAIAGAEVYVSDGTGPIRRVLGRSDVSPYQSTEGAISVVGRKVLVNTLCISWSSYPGYDVAVLDVDSSAAQWWWEAFPSQFDVPALPKPTANIAGPTWQGVTRYRMGTGLVTSMPSTL